MSGEYRRHNELHEGYLPEQRGRRHAGSDWQECTEVYHSTLWGPVCMHQRPARASAVPPALSDWDSHEHAKFAAQTFDGLRLTTYNGAHHECRTLHRQRPTSSPTYRTTARPFHRISDLDFHGPGLRSAAERGLLEPSIEDSSIRVAQNSEARVKDLEPKLLACDTRLKDTESQLAAKNFEVEALQKRNKSLEQELKQSIYTASVLATTYNENTHTLMESLKREREGRSKQAQQVEQLSASNSLRDQHASPFLMQGRGKALCSAAAAVSNGQSEVGIESRALLYQASQVFDLPPQKHVSHVVCHTQTQAFYLLPAVLHTRSLARA